MSWRIPLADLDFNEEEEQAVLEIVQSRWLTMGAVTKTFEDEFSNFVSAKHALAVSNATVGLHLSCISLGIGPGDEVIVPSLTFVATANAVLYTGAQVKFADIVGEEDLTISPESIREAITDKTKAIIVMHYGGFPCHMDEIKSIAAQHRLSIIEDAAHAPGSFYQGQSLGTWGDVGCFSFFSNKNLSTGEGGMVVTNRGDIADRVRVLRSHGMTSLTWDRHQGHAYSYDVVDLGYNYRIDEIRSALGLVQLSKLAKGNARRAEITHRYWQSFQNSGLGLPFLGVSGRYAHHLFPILLPREVDRLKFIDRLRADGIQTSIHYPPIHQFSYYKKLNPEISLPITEDVSSREVTLPLYATMSDENAEFVIDRVLAAL